MSNTLVVAGNPRPASRTLASATVLARTLGDQLSLTVGPIIDLALVAGRLFDPDDAEVNTAVRAIRSAQVAVVASPTYKASITGLLKAFLDRIPGDGLVGVVVIPVMTGGSDVHRLAPDVFLRPVLLELGATAPTGSLFFTDADLARVDEVVTDWCERHLEVLRAVTRR
jgi:FMN reductase